MRSRRRGRRRCWSCCCCRRGGGCWRRARFWCGAAGLGVLLVVVGRNTGGGVAGDGVKRLANGCARKGIARLYHVWQVIPGIGSGGPGDRTVAGSEADLATRKYPSTIVNTRGGSRARRRQIGDCGIVPAVGVWIVAVSLNNAPIATARVNITAQGHRHQAMDGTWIISGHGPAVCSNIVNLDVKIRAHAASCDAVDFAVEVRCGVKVGSNGIRGQARVIGIADRIVAPKRGSRKTVFVQAAKQVDISAVACGAAPVARFRKESDGRPGIDRGVVLVSVCDGSVVGDTAETVNVAILGGHGVSRYGDWVGSLLSPGAARRARSRGGGRAWRGSNLHFK